MKTQTRVMHITLIGAFIVLFALSIVLSLIQVPQMGSVWRKDLKLIPALQNISNLIPEDEDIVSPNFDPILLYVTQRQIHIPHKVNNYSSLLNYMEKENYTYFLFIEGKYRIPTSVRLFEKNDLSGLSKDFNEIALYVTQFSKLHLYKRINQTEIH